MTEGTGGGIEEEESRALGWVKPGVRAVAAYTLRRYEPRIKLNQNESPYDVPIELKRAIQARLVDRPWNLYPPFVADDFIAAVSEATGWPTGGILVGNGSNELIQAILAVVVGRGVKVVVPEPTFTLYGLMTRVNEGEVVPVPLDEELAFDVDAIIEAARETRAAAVVLCTPNNPTGTALSREQILRVHDETDALILLDQAYVEFGGYDAIPLLDGRPRLVVLRTFSKAMSLAGLRAGYMLACPALVEQVNKAKLPYNINFFSEAVAAEVLRGRELFAPQVARIREERERVAARLRLMRGLRLYSSDANFLLVRIEALDHRAVFRRLLDEYGILVRDVSAYPMLDRCLRVSIGAPEQNDELLAALSIILDGVEK